MSTLTTNDIKNVGQLQEKNEFASNDALLAWDAAGQKHVKLTYQKLNQAYSTIQSACETAQGAAEGAAAEAAGFAKGTGGGTYTNNNAEYFKTQAAAEALKSEGWAKGTQNGTAVASGDYFHNNAEWFKDQAAQSATDAASSASDASDSETAAATSETNALSYKNAAETAANQARSYASIILMASGTVDQQKTVSLPASGLLEGQIIRVMFPVGHNASGSAVYMTLNGNLVLSNQNGALAPIPRHAMTEGGSTVYKVLDPNTTLEMYYTANYDGNQTPAFVIIGNPLVLSSSTYSIYANGQVGDEQVATVRSILSNKVPYGWLMCDDTVRHKEDYPKLWDEIPDIFKNTANNTFVIDLRGRAVMGADGSNPLGTSQDSQNKSHSHEMNHIHDRGNMEIIGHFGNYINNYGSGTFKGDGCFYEEQYPQSGWSRKYIDEGRHVDNAVITFVASRNWTGYTGAIRHADWGNPFPISNTANSGETEARPKNVRMNWIIKY